MILKLVDAVIVVALIAALNVWYWRTRRQDDDADDPERDRMDVF